VKLPSNPDVMEGEHQGFGPGWMGETCGLLLNTPLYMFLMSRVWFDKPPPPYYYADIDRESI
jgi:hypothetical protein